MARENCPNLNTPEWRRLTDKVNVHEAWKMFYKYDEEGYPDPVDQALTVLAEPVSKKIRDTEANSKQYTLVTQDEGGKTHHYVYDNHKPIPSVSEWEDSIEVLKYKGSDTDENDEGKKYSDVGTEVHAVWEDAINSNDPGTVYQTLVDKHGDRIPENYIRQVINFIGDLKARGVVRAETPIGFQGTAEVDALAGTIDIILYENDGSMHIYDIKTIHQTEQNVPRKWDVAEKGGYKAKRYSTQAVMYGELLGRATGQPVASYHIIPAEVSYNNVDNLEEGIKDINFLSAENIENYDYLPGARLHVDGYFQNKTRQSFNYQGPADTSQAILEKLTGVNSDQWSRTSPVPGEAKEILAKTKFTGKGGDEFYEFPLGTPHKLNSLDPVEQLNQVINESILPSREAGNDAVNSVLNYIHKGKDLEIDKGENAAINKVLVEEYKNSNFTAVQLDTIQGFENKSGWVLLSNGNRRDLLYIGKETLSSKLNLKTPEGKISNQNSLFAHLDSRPKNRYVGAVLKNSMLDLKKTEAVLIAAQLLQENPEINIGKMSIAQESRTTKYAAVVNPKDVLESLELVVDDVLSDPDKVDPRLAELLKVDRSRFTIDAAEAYLDMMRTRKLGEVSSEVNMYTAQGVEKYLAGTLNKQEVSDIILNEVTKLKSNRAEGTAITVEEGLLSELFFQLQGVDIWDNPVGKIQSKIFTRNDLPGSIMTFLNKQISTHLTRFREEYWGEYKKKSIKHFDALIKRDSGGLIAKVADRTVSQTSRYYEKFYVVREMQQQDGSMKKVRLPELIHPESAEYKKLSEADQKFLTHIFNTLAEGAEQAGLKNWDVTQLPLMKSSNMNSIYKVGRGETSMKDAAERYWEGLTENFEFVGQVEAGVYRANNWFQKQTDSISRNEVAGYVGNEIHDQVRFESFETNLEVVLDMFMINAGRMKHMNQLAKNMAAAHSVYDFKSTQLVDPGFTNNAQFVQDMETVIIQNKALDSGSLGDKVVTGMSRVVSSMTLGYNFKSAFAIGLGQELLLMSRTLANTWIGTGAGAKEYAQAGIFMAKNPALTLELIDLYGLVDMDSSSLMSGVRRTGNKSLLQAKNQFAMLQFGDKISKGHYLVAEMIKDGSIKAYSMNSDANIVYDENADPRFTKGEEGAALKSYLKRNMELDGTLKDGKMTRGWDFQLSQNFGHKVTRIFGGYDRDTRVLASYTALGKLFFMHKNFLPAIMGRMIRQKTISDIEGKLEYFTRPDGTKDYRWVGQPSEGLLVSALVAMKHLMNLRNNPKPLEQYQKDNLKVLAADITVMAMGFGIASMIGSAIGDDDRILGSGKVASDNNAWVEFAHGVALGGLRDMTASYDISQARTVFMPVVIDVSMKTLNQLWNFPAGDTTLTDLLQIPAIGKQIGRIIELTTD